MWTFLLASFLASLVSMEARCKAKVDLGFILDSSGSLRADYGREKHFVNRIADSFSIGRDATRAGVITFSYHAEHSIKLKDTNSFGAFNQSVNNIPLMGYTTRIDKALEMANTEMFTQASGGRPDVPDLLILLTDGSQSPGPDAKDPGAIAVETRNKGIHLIVIGIGKNVNKTELNHIAGRNHNHLFTAASFDHLVSSDFIEKLQERACSSFTVAKWGRWVGTACSATCGAGTIRRTRECIGGKPGDGQCTGPDVEQVPCNLAKCPIPAKWRPWYSGPCSVTCGNGTQLFWRRCRQGNCKGASTRSLACNLQPCKVAKWGRWVDTPCSTTCGAGTIRRTRECIGGEPGEGQCTGPDVEQVPCSLAKCPIPAKWGPWYPGPCSVTCGNGTQLLWRRCRKGNCKGASTQSLACNLQPCRGPIYTLAPTWDSWGLWKPCSTICGGGTQYRTRNCIGGKAGEERCKGDSTQRLTCNLQACKAPTWDSWGRWKPCSATCGVGTQHRSRECIGGKAGEGQCKGYGIQSSTCNLQACKDNRKPPSGQLRSLFGQLGTLFGKLRKLFDHLGIQDWD